MMASIETSHYEYTSDKLSIIVYGVKESEVLPISYNVIPQISTLKDLMPDIFVKSVSTQYMKKAILIYNTEKELVQMK